MRTWVLAVVMAVTTMCFPSAAGEECLEVVNLGSCGPWAVGKYHKQDDEQNGKPVWHNAGDHVRHTFISFPLVLANACWMVAILSDPRA